MIEAEFEEIDRDEDQLDLSEDDSLPWLEADEDDDAAGGVDTAQVIGFFLILLALLACVVGAIWYFTNRTGDTAMVADGSTIEAPEGPIKERPEDPGGKEFDGTGNVAPVVGEGGTRDGVMNTDGNGVSAGAEGAASGSAAGTSAGASAGSGTASSASSGASGVGVQLAAYSTRARAEQGWNDLSRRTDALAGARYRIEQGTVDIGTVFRLQAVASDRAAADRLCAALKSDGLDCQVK